MTSFTVKNILKQLVSFGNKNQVTWKMQGEDTGRNYTFVVVDKNVTLFLETKQGTSIRTDALDFEVEKFQDKTFKNLSFQILKYTKDSKKHYKLIDVQINYDAQMYVELFRLLREHVYVEFKVGNKHFYAQYIEGRLCFRDTTCKDKYLLYSGDLYSLHNLFNYEIIKIGTPLTRQGFFRTVKNHEKFAKDAGLPFVHKILGKRGELDVQI